MDRTARNRAAWDLANRKYLDDPGSLDGADLAPVEIEVLDPLLATRPRVVHLQSGNGADVLALLRRGATSAIGVDFSVVGVDAADRRAHRIGTAAIYVVGALPLVPLAGGCADLVYTGKGAVMWLSDLVSWASEVARLLAPDGHLFVYDAHPAAPLWTRERDHVGVVPDASYFGGTRVNDTFPASAIARYDTVGGHDAVEWQWTLSDIVNAVIGAGLEILRLGEHAEPFWRPNDGSAAAAAWEGRLPNAFTLLARRGRVVQPRSPAGPPRGHPPAAPARSGDV